MASDSITSSKASIINWNESWKELDLVFGTAISNDSSEVLLDPSDYGVTPHGGVQFADVALLGSDSANRVYASFDNYINTKGGNDTLFSIDDYTGNQIVGGTGSDKFFLQATDNLILGGEIFADSDSHALSNDVALTDFEADAFLIASSSKQVSLGQDLKIHDFEVNRDSVSIDGLKIDVSDWTAARDLLSSNNIDINATPESILERITISLLEGVTTNTNLAPFILDRDNDSLRVIKITGPDWITLSGTVLTANTPNGVTEEGLQAIDLQIGYTDEKVVSPFSAHLTLNKAPTALELTDVTTSLVENTDTSQPIKLADISITDDALGSSIITLSGNDAAAFEVSDNALLLKAGTTLDFETKSSYNITVNVADPDLTTSTPISTPFSLTLTDVNKAPTGGVTISGTATQGETLTADISEIADADGLGDFSYQWKADGADITGATAKTFVPTQDQVGKAITVVVSYTDGGGTAESLTSDATSAVANVNDVPTGNVVIDGTATQGQTLTANTNAIADADGLGTFSYQWKADGADISGATASTYTLTQAEVGKTITVTASYTDGGGTAESLTSDATSAVANVNDVPTGNVVIDGTATQGQTLTANTNAIADADGLGFISYRWKADDQEITRATTKSLILTESEVGKIITVTASYTDGFGKRESISSFPTSAVANINDEPTLESAIPDQNATQDAAFNFTVPDSTFTDIDAGDTLTLSATLSNGSDLPTWLTFTPETATFSGTPTNSDVGSIEVKVTAADAEASVSDTFFIIITNVNDDPTGILSITGTPTQGATLTADTTGIADADGLGTFSYQWKAGGVDINGATASTFVLTQDQVGKAITVTVSYIDGFGESESLTSDATSTVANINDSPTGKAVITGTPTQGATLTADVSAIADADGLGSFSYQWKAGGVDINGATASTFVLTQDQVGKAITVTVSYIDGFGASESLTSDATSTVANINDSPTGIVVINGTATQGQTLTADTTGIADADGLGSGDFSYQWKADDVDITGATASTYTLTQAEVGKPITVTASYTDGGGTAESLTSIATAAVSNSNNSPTGKAVITGTPTQGATLTADVSAIADADGLGTFSYQWKADGVDINGATQSTFALTQDQVGKAITVSASYTDGGGTAESLTSAATSDVANINDDPEGTIQISGNPIQGETLRAAVASINDADGVPQLDGIEFQWQSNGTDITDATTDSYTLTQADVDRVISVRVSYTDGGGTPESLTSADTAAVINRNDSPTGIVVINGTATQGKTLTANTDDIADADGLGSFSYQWKADGVDINGATQSTFALTQDQVGKAISVTASYTDGQGSAESLTSTATSAVQNVNDPATGSVVISGKAAQGETLTANTSAIADVDGLGTFSYQWKADDVDINGATAKTFVPTQAQVGQAITVTTSYTDGGGTAESLTSAATSAVANVNDVPTGQVVIDGQAAEGFNLEAKTTSIKDLDGLGSFSYQWKADGFDIAGATASTYVLTETEAGKAITVTASYTDGQNTSESLSSQPTVPVVSAQSLLSGYVSIDSVNGKIQQGTTLTANIDAIRYNDSTIGQANFQWFADGAPLQGATSQTFTPQQEQVGQTISVQVIEPDSSATRLSEITTSVANINDSPTGKAVITGTPTQGATLTADVSAIADADGLGTFSYQWKADGSDITGATDSTLVLTQEQVGKAITVITSYTDGFGASESLTSDATSAVANVNDAPTGNVIITGFLLAGQTLNALDTLGDLDGLGTRTYTWQRTTGDGQWLDIDSQSVPTQTDYGFHTLSADDAGHLIRVLATYTDGQGSEETIQSPITGRVIGQLSEGRQISYESADLQTDFQWEIRQSANGNWSPLADQSTKALLTDKTWGGQQVRLTVNGQALPELSIVPINSGAGSLAPLETDGPLTEGVTLAAGLPLNDPDGLKINTSNLEYQWQKYDADENTWKAIAGANSSKYTTTSADTNQPIRAVLSYVDEQNYSNTIFSNSLKVSAIELPIPTGTFNPIADDGILTVDEYINNNSTIALSGSILENQSDNTSVSIQFGGQTRQATVVTADLAGISSWSYTITLADQKYLIEGEANSIAATLTRNEDGKTGSTTYANTLVVSPDIEFTGSNPNSASDPSQSDGIKQEVKEVAKVTLASFLSPELIESIGLPNVAVAPLGSADDFNAGSDASPESYGFFELPGYTSAAGLETFSENPDGGYTIPNQSGIPDSIAAPDLTSFIAAADPIALTIKDVDPGATIKFNFILPQSSSNQLPSDLSQARLYKLDNSTNELRDYANKEGVKYYTYSLVNDQNNNGFRDDGDSVKITVQLTDGDPLWDRDGQANGTIVDPFVSGEFVNGEPAGTDNTLTILEGASHTFSAADFGFSDSADDNGFQSVTITTIPGAGSLSLNGTDVSDGDVIAVSDLSNLVFSPATDANGAGYASFTFQVTDDGGTANNGKDTDQSPNTITFNVTAVNDAPAGKPTITGTPTQGETLTADASAIADADGLGTFSYQWLADDTAIAGATASTLVLTQEQVGKAIAVTVSYTDGGGTAESLTSAVTATVASDKTSVSLNGFNADLIDTREVANPDEMEDLGKRGIELSPVAIDFERDLDQGINDATTTIPLDFLLGDLEITDADGKRDPNKDLIYYSIDASGSISPLSYDALQGGGARFYDSNGDGVADLLSLKLVDGGIGDNDRVENGVIVDPSALGTVSLDPIISQLKSGFIQVSDAANSSPASFALQASLTSRATSATEIGYVIINDGESATVVDDFTAFKARAKTLFSSLESDDIVLESTMQFEREFLLRNGQNIRFFSVSDATLDDLSGLDDSRLSFFNSSIDNLTGQASFSNANAVAFELSLLEGDQDLSALIAQEQTIAPLLDFTAFTNNETVSGSIVQSREADYDAITGFYRVLDTSGSVRAADGSLLTPGDAGYAAAALHDANQVATFSDLSVADGQSSSTDFSLQDSGTFAPFAQVNGYTFFAFADANADGLSHFRSLGANLFGLEDQLGGGDLDFDDHIIGFNITGLS